MRWSTFPSYSSYLLSKRRKPTVGNIDNRKDDGLEALVKHVGLAELGLEICGARHDQPGHIGPVPRYEILDSSLCHLPISYLFCMILLLIMQGWGEQVTLLNSGSCLMATLQHTGDDQRIRQPYSNTHGAINTKRKNSSTTRKRRMFRELGQCSTLRT